MLDIAAHGRAFLPWVMKPGLRLEIWMLATANGMFLDADGTRTLVTDQLMVVNPLQFLTFTRRKTSTGPYRGPRAPAAAIMN